MEIPSMRWLRLLTVTTAAFVLFWVDALHLMPSSSSDTHAATG